MQVFDVLRPIGQNSILGILKGFMYSFFDIPVKLLVNYRGLKYKGKLGALFRVIFLSASFLSISFSPLL